jgi:hypothetical protein
LSPRHTGLWVLVLAAVGLVSYAVLSRPPGSKARGDGASKGLAQ